ncbi:unnamed protein product [Mesocestoides corti]|uniref:Uncharacterized protein n=2 Tax=Mesocestoides corti TaxID=53468 RepID=A0A0R3U4A2_MESCO|nr:unnamed protein product [Mesocestoides corti]
MEPSHAQSQVTDESSIQVQESGVSDIGSDESNLSDSGIETDTPPEMDSDSEVISDEAIYYSDCLDDEYALWRSLPDSTLVVMESWEYMFEMELEYEAREAAAALIRNQTSQVLQRHANELDIGPHEPIQRMHASDEYTNALALCYAIWACLEVTDPVNCLPKPGNDK